MCRSLAITGEAQEEWKLGSLHVGLWLVPATVGLIHCWQKFRCKRYSRLWKIYTRAKGKKLRDRTSAFFRCVVVVAASCLHLPFKHAANDFIIPVSQYLSAAAPTSTAAVWFWLLWHNVADPMIKNMMTMKSNVTDWNREKLSRNRECVQMYLQTLAFAVNLKNVAILYLQYAGTPYRMCHCAV